MPEMTADDLARIRDAVRRRDRVTVAAAAKMAEVGCVDYGQCARVAYDLITGMLHGNDEGDT